MIIIGLGNPTEKHALDRHNIGFQVLDAYVEDSESSFSEKAVFEALVAVQGALFFAKPTTWMNDSGLCAKKLFQQYKELPVVVYDDIDIPLGQVKCSFGRGAGGHNGVQSIIDHLVTKDFFRIRVGVRPVHDELKSHILPPDGFQNFLLKPFAPFEKELHEQGVKQACEVIEKLSRGVLFQDIMNMYN